MSVIRKTLKTLLRALQSTLSARRARRLADALSALPQFDGITLVDIGAAGDIQARWKKIERLIDYIGFEPDERSRNQLLSKENNCKSYKILPFAVWEETGQIKINFCRKPEASSFYTPNFALFNRYRNPKRVDVLSVESIKATTLDDLSLGNSDFIKIDIQGGELNALRGGQKSLKDTLGLELEVEFLPIYVDQPLFGEICSFLADHGFEFTDFPNLARWGRDSRSGFGQCVLGDALFLRTPESVASTSGIDFQSLSKYLSICLVYNRFDFIDTVLGLVPDADAIEFSEFKIKTSPLRRSFQRARAMSRFTNDFLQTLGLGEYRVHLIC